MSLAARALCAATALFALAGQAVSCELPQGWQRMTPDGETDIQAALTSDPAPVPVHAPFQVKIAVCAPGGEVDRISFDATMPAHGHGMNYAAPVETEAKGRYRLTGLLFHMPGRWQARLTVYSADAPAHFTLDLDVE